VNSVPKSPEVRLLPWSEVCKRVPLSRATVWQLRRTGRFPKPIQISPNRIAWRESDLAQWLSTLESGVNR
jgi:prophage regulatory protein